MTVQELTTYLKTAAELESSIYRQEKAIEEAKDSLRKAEPNPPGPPPTSLDLRLLSIKKRAVKELTPLKEEKKTLFISGAICLLIVALLYKSYVAMGFLDTLVLCIFAGCFIVVAFVIFFDSLRTIKNYNTEIIQYEKAQEAAMEEYNAKAREITSKYNQEQNQYDRKVQRVENYKLRRPQVLQQIESMNMSLKASKYILSDLYAFDHIFPKYRNMVAMCTIYEYFASGRCTELTGPDGAYNLYENELRQNIIIEKLDTVINQLNQIQRNQYTLYKEIQKTNQTLDMIQKDVRQALNSIQNIERISLFTAHFAEITAQNTKALKYISLIK